MGDLSLSVRSLSICRQHRPASPLTGCPEQRVPPTTASPSRRHPPPCLQSCSYHQEMAGIYIILLLGCLGTCMGQGLGSMHTVSEVLWLDDYTQDAMPILVAVGNRPPDEPMYSDVETTTPAPERDI
ncbi:hypothetical protein E2C01_013772 [Portunus trituberculatus]|uniref:Uncharacterized protein n=1 Tax=Portunus trituberculatus TaxID=210409 RepID=A0A5B7DH47_PORTR|nr:hypothetical protein [Portunus trituberculatus]